MNIPTINRKRLLCSKESGMTNKTISLYFLLQGALGIFWQALLIISPGFRISFALYKSHPDSIFSFLLPDLLFFCFGSLFCSWVLFKNKEWAKEAVNFTSGGILYVTLFCINHSLLRAHDYFIVQNQ